MDPLTDSSAQLTEHWLTAHTSQGGSSRQMRQLSFNSQGCQHGEISRNVNLAHTREYVFGNVCQHAAQMASRVSLAPHYFRERTWHLSIWAHYAWRSLSDKQRPICYWANAERRKKNPLAKKEGGKKGRTIVEWYTIEEEINDEMNEVSCCRLLACMRDLLPCFDVASYPLFARVTHICR